MRPLHDLAQLLMRRSCGQIRVKSSLAQVLLRRSCRDPAEIIYSRDLADRKISYENLGFFLRVGDLADGTLLSIFSYG